MTSSILKQLLLVFQEMNVKKPAINLDWIKEGQLNFSKENYVIFIKLYYFEVDSYLSYQSKLFDSY